MPELKSIFALELSEFLELKQKTITQSSAKHYVRILTDFDLFIADRNISEKIIRIADNIPVNRAVPSSGYSRYTFPMLLRLLIGCGLRLNETLSLKVGDVNFKDGVLLMKQTKNNKQRLVPMDDSLNEMLKRYSHFDMNGTERYLKFFGDMFSEHTHRFEDYANGVFSGGLYEDE
jgi:integrase